MEKFPEQVYENWMKGLSKWVVLMFNVGKKVGGETYLRQLEEEFSKAGAEIATKICSQIGESGTDGKAIGRLFDILDESLGNYWDDHVENSPTGFEKHILTCPLADTFSKAPEICTRLLLASGQGLVSKINPNATFQLTEFLCKGDKSCHYRVEVNASD